MRLWPGSAIVRSRWRLRSRSDSPHSFSISSVRCLRHFTGRGYGKRLQATGDRLEKTKFLALGYGKTTSFQDRRLELDILRGCSVRGQVDLSALAADGIAAQPYAPRPAVTSSYGEVVIGRHVADVERPGAIQVVCRYIYGDGSQRLSPVSRNGDGELARA